MAEPSGAGPATRAWLALLIEEDETRSEAVALDGLVAALPAVDAETGLPAGWLAGWRRAGRPHREAVRMDPAGLWAGAGDDPEADAEADRDPDATPDAAVSLVLVPPASRPLFDDPTVVGATRRALVSSARCRTVSTLVTDAVHLAGAVSVQDADVVGRRSAWWREDPFALVHRPRRLLVAGRLFAPTALRGPGTQRYAGVPWPGGRF